MSTRVHPADGGVDTTLFDFDTEDPENACINYENCGSIVPANGMMCGSCLDTVRRVQRRRERDRS